MNEAKESKLDHSDKDIHVMPNDGRHDDSPSCFCEPTKTYQDEFTGKSVWVHKSQEEMLQ